MSMPTFPPNGADMTREQALTMIIASIAMEECSLSHIIDAEGEKLRYILDRLDTSCNPCTATKEILEVNRSVTKLLDVVMQNQLLLRNKLALALEPGCCPPECPPKEPCCPPSKPPHRPCPPPKPPKPCPEHPPCSCPAPQRSTLQLVGPDGGYLWKNGCAMPWECQNRQGRNIHWMAETPTLVELDPRHAYCLNCCFTICDFLPTEASGRICLDWTTEGLYPEQPPLWFSIRCSGGEPITLQHSALLLPCGGSAPVAGLTVRLRTRGVLCVEQAVMNVVEL